MQGDVHEHQESLNRLGVKSTEIKLPDQLEGIDGLIIPGGESTTIVQLIDIFGFREAISQRVETGMAVWGTCAGMIAIADRLTDARPEPLKLMDIEVTRNAFGRQRDSFEEDIEILGDPGPPFRAIFIRAPSVSYAGEEVAVLARIKDGSPVALRQGRVMATAFHPELVPDGRIHKQFVRLVERSG